MAALYPAALGCGVRGPVMLWRLTGADSMHRLQTGAFAIELRRRAAPTTEQREARLQQLRTNHRHLPVAETAEQRAARLQQLSANQRARLAADTLRNLHKFPVPWTPVVT